MKSDLLSVYDVLYHEPQEAALCGQHCLNNLLQQRKFTETDLMDIANELDRREREVMSEAGNTAVFQSFLQREDSSNIADDGNFSIQVLMEALKTVNITLVPLDSSDPVAVAARRDAWNQKAYVCNLLNHWFCLRRIGRRWWNLNSLYKTPELVSQTFLTIYLEQLKMEGYSIFLVVGNLPPCQAEEAEAQGLLADPEKTWAGVARGPAISSHAQPSASHSSQEDDDELEAAIAASLAPAGGTGGGANTNIEEETLRKVLNESRQEAELEEQRREEQRRAVEQALVAEPPEGPEASLLVIRLPDGSRVQRRFPGNGPLQHVDDFLRSKGLQVNQYQLVSTFPRQTYTDSSLSLQALGLHPKAMLIVEKKL
mmetsp:Transcript_1695/g.3247  ORF Transcript_1695/g.3247 Transcript_1695/m.3247 type:complete len:370 (-) Transcript_1695:180-1289(-)